MLDYLFIFPIPLLLFVIGVIILNTKAYDINSVVGYRTPRSMRDKRSWDWAQQMMAEYFIYYGIISLIVSIILSVLCIIFYNKEFVPCAILLLQTIGIFGVIVKVEGNLKKEHERWDKK